jgi:hypothetical protein
MAGLGNNSNPLEIGDPKCWEADIEAALLEAYAPVFDVSGETIVAIEAGADAAAVATIWAASERLANQGQALKMIEALPIWEEACGLRPAPDESERERREALAAKRRGYAGNAAPDIRDICDAAMGGAFVAIHHVPDDQAVSYWPGINPGPPGFEWMSTSGLVFAEVTTTGLGQAEFARRTARMSSTVDDVLSGECRFDWFVRDEVDGESGFFIGRSLLGVHGL